MNSNRNWVLQVKPKVYKTFNKFSKDDRERILEIIEKLPSDPYAGDIEKMEGQENSWRRRVGAYRIFYEISMAEKLVHVFRVERRTSKTY
ncbi:MAG: type II toxin-antitoxin system RelE/ParE family toxin [Candidatus Colwellbacteria bacterium]|nr:type II toxin-antitoxin system RelE/ParE family toxin [Candidatus Colwellbacteria bacterium]